MTKQGKWGRIKDEEKNSKEALMGYFRSQDIRLLLFLNNRLHLKGLKAFMRAYTHLGGVAFHSCLAIFLLFAERPQGLPS